jgi:hypothetical protein
VCFHTSMYGSDRRLCHIWDTLSVHSSIYWTLKMKAICSSETSVNFLQTTRRYIPEGNTLYKNSIRTSQETHHVSATETNRLMLFGEVIAVYCENHTEHINTLCGQNAETLYIRIQFVPHRKQHFSATETNRLMLFLEKSLFIVRTIWNT